MNKIEIAVLRSSFQTDEWVWNEYSNLIGALTIDSSAHFTIVPDEAAVLPDFPVPDFVMIATGGVENLFTRLLPRLKQPVRLIADGRNNSLAAALEILSFLRCGVSEGEIINGSTEQITAAVNTPYMTATAAETARKATHPSTKTPLAGLTVALFGRPSDWLIASSVDNDVMDGYGLKIKNIPLDLLIEQAREFPSEKAEALADCYLASAASSKVPRESVVGSMKVYGALKEITEFEQVDAFTVRCFDMISALGATSCLALSMLNDEGLTAGCEGDMQTLMTMLLVRALTGRPSFMANPSWVRDGRLLLAHCTVPQAMCTETGVDTHFESGIGAATAGRLPLGHYTVVKWGGHRLERCFVAEADAVQAEWSGHLCRTQLTLSADHADYFLHRPIGNHHVVVAGAYAEEIRQFMYARGVKIEK